MNAVELVKKSSFILFGKEKIAEFEEKLLLNSSRTKKIEDFLKTCVIQGTLLMIVGMVTTQIFVKNKPEAFIAVGIICFFIPFFWNYFFQDILFEKRKKEKEILLPDVLLEASVFCDESSLMDTIKRLAEQDFGLVSADFKRALEEIKKGASVEEALERIKRMNKSKIYNRTIDLFLQSYKSGAHMSQALKETAEDILENQAIIRERQAVMIVNKYTLIISSALIVPAIIGTIIALVSGLNVSGIEEIGFGLSGEERAALFETAKIGAVIYVTEYAVLASYFLALQEGNKKNFLLYAIFLLPFSLMVFIIAQII